MKRYLLFIYNCHFPSGGMKDCAGDFDNIEAAESFYKAKDRTGDNYYNVAHVYDTDAKLIIEINE